MRVRPAAVWVCREICQEVCPWNVRFADPAAERDHAHRPARDAVWDRGPADGDVSGETLEDDTSSDDDDGPTKAVISTTDGPALVGLMRMAEDEWDACTRRSAMRRAGYRATAQRGHRAVEVAFHQ